MKYSINKYIPFCFMLFVLSPNNDIYAAYGVYLPMNPPEKEEKDEEKDIDISMLLLETVKKRDLVDALENPSKITTAWKKFKEKDFIRALKQKIKELTKKDYDIFIDWLKSNHEEAYTLLYPNKYVTTLYLQSGFEDE